MENDKGTPRKLPPDDALKVMFEAEPEVPNTVWAKRFGVSRQRISQKRIKLGLQQVPDGIERKDHQFDPIPSGRTCVICTTHITYGRFRICGADTLTCSHACSIKYRNLSKKKREALAQ